MEKRINYINNLLFCEHNADNILKMYSICEQINYLYKKVNNLCGQIIMRTTYTKKQTNYIDNLLPCEHVRPSFVGDNWSTSLMISGISFRLSL